MRKRTATSMTSKQPNKDTEARTDTVCASLALSPRLRCIADRVPLGARLADVGTDHGYLPVWLLQNGRIERAIASDINAGPLEHARRTAEAYGFSGHIELRLCAGLDGVAPDEADVIVIAGMGGETIVDILRGAARRWDGTTLLLQPMTKAELLRRWLTENGFRIASEQLARDRGTIYAAIEARAGKSGPLTPAEAWCGVGLLRDPLYGEYARDRIRKLERAAAGMRRAKTVDAAAIRALEADAVALREKVKEWEDANCT